MLLLTICVNLPAHSLFLSTFVFSRSLSVDLSVPLRIWFCALARDTTHSYRHVVLARVGFNLTTMDNRGHAQLGIDNGVDALIASVLTVASSIYAANLLHVKDTALAPGSPPVAQTDALSRAVHVTLSRVAALLLDAASVDEALRCNSGVVWVAAQLQSGASCGGDTLRRMGLAAIPPRPRHGLVAPSRLTVKMSVTRTPPPPRESTPLARATARELLARHRRLTAA